MQQDNTANPSTTPAGTQPPPVPPVPPVPPQIPVDQIPIPRDPDDFTQRPLMPRVIKSHHKDDGQTKCPKCGATDIQLSSKTGKLRCNFCRTEFDAQLSDDFVEDIFSLDGEELIGEGATNIAADTNDVVTLKCDSCGAEVVIDTAESAQARCHWCRNTLSLNQAIPNGGVPDVVLPFALTREQAKDHISQFVGKRIFYAHPRFKAEFNADNVMGVYLPYMLVDSNTRVRLEGRGEHTAREYYVTEEDSDGKKRRVKRYDVDIYSVRRIFRLAIKGLSIEGSADKLERHTSNRTNNIINSIMPFDTENCQKWDANFLRGYTSEKRDVNIDELRSLINVQCADVARFSALGSIKYYDRGVRWDDERMQVLGRQWRTAYLHVWLYSYQQKKRNGEDSVLHYVAVNARTSETMGSVPINKPKLFVMSLLVEIVCWFAKIFALDPIAYGENGNYEWWPWAIMLGGFGYYYYVWERYRNSGARHHHENETDAQVDDMQEQDEFLRQDVEVSESSMTSANHTRVRG